MKRQARPQLGYALRATLWLAAMLPLWWFGLRGPLLDWERVASTLLLRAIPGTSAPLGVNVRPAGDWEVRVPAPGMRYRSVEIVVEQRVPTLGTVNLALFWAFLLAGPWSWRLWRSFLVGSGISLAVQPFGLLAYSAHVVVVHLYPQAPKGLAVAVSFADYLGSNVLPYILPMLLVLALQPDLRALVLGDEVAAAPEERPGSRSRRRSTIKR